MHGLLTVAQNTLKRTTTTKGRQGSLSLPIPICLFSKNRRIFLKVDLGKEIKNDIS